jgi:hypothetical protein
VIFEAKGFFFYFRFMSLQIKGKIQQILKPESGVSRAGKDWKKQEFVLESNEQFPKKICFSILNDRLSLLEKIKQGDEVEVYFNLESRDYNGKWFHNINVWKLEKVSADQNQPDTLPEYRLEDIPPEPAGQDNDDLPF